MQTSTTNNAPKEIRSTIDHLNSFLRGELSAVETYRQAIEKLATSTYRPVLDEGLRSHEQRAQWLTEEILRLGGQPAQSSGVWGAFAKLVEGGAKLFGEKAAISALEEGEDHGRDDYRRHLDSLDVTTRAWIEKQILPEQRRTHDAMSATKKSIH